MDRKTIIAESDKVFEEAVEHRRHLHAHPEPSYREHATAAYISSVLTRAGIKHRPIAETGILAKIEGRGDLKKATVLRADIDALHIHETTGLSYSSQNFGVMHACGHDMHAAALLGALLVLSRHREDINGTLFGLFQPGEEVCPGGATLVLNENPFEDYDVKAFIAQHVEPDLPAGTFGFREGQYMASGDEVRFTVTGEGGHAAMREKLNDPIPAAAALITSLRQAADKAASGSPLPVVFSIGRVIADGTTNVIPELVYMEGTLRTFDENMRKSMKQMLRDKAVETVGAYGIDIEVNITDGYPSVVNSPGLTRRAKEFTAGMFGEQAVTGLELRPTTEDFGYYTQLYPSLFYRLGVGHTSGAANAGRLHTAEFNPSEEALRYGIAELVNLALNLE